MNNIYDLLNLSNIPLDKKIELAINETKAALKNITYERTCKIYSQYVFNYLNQNHVVNKIINTNEIGANYEHHFVLIPINGIDYYLIDLTFKQFNNNDINFNELYERGYQKVNDYTFINYLGIVTGEKLNVGINEIYTKRIKIK